MAGWMDNVADDLIARAERMIRFAKRVNADYERPAMPVETLSANAQEALILAYNALLGGCRCHRFLVARTSAVASIARVVKAAGYVWQQTPNGQQILIRPRGEEQRRHGRSSTDPHAGMNPTMTEQRTKARL